MTFEQYQIDLAPWFRNNSSACTDHHAIDLHFMKSRVGMWLVNSCRQIDKNFFKVWCLEI